MSNLIDRQAAIDAAIKATDDWDGGYNITRANMIEKELNDLPSAQPEQKWTPCKTGILPEKKDEFYQATYLLDDGDRMVDYVYFDSKGMWSNYAYEYSELLAWMPLPEAYKEDNR